MGTGKGNIKRINKQSELKKTNNKFSYPPTSQLAKIFNDQYVAVSDFIYEINNDNNNLSNKTYREYYLGCTSQDFMKDYDKNMSYCLTQIMHDLFEQKCFTQKFTGDITDHKDFSYALDKINYKDYEIIFHNNTDYCLLILLNTQTKEVQNISPIPHAFVSRKVDGDGLIGTEANDSLKLSAWVRIILENTICETTKHLDMINNEEIQELLNNYNQ